MNFCLIFNDFRKIVGYFVRFLDEIVYAYLYILVFILSFFVFVKEDKVLFINIDGIIIFNIISFFVNFLVKEC